MYKELPSHLKYILALALALIAFLLLMPSMAELNGENGPDFFIFMGRFHIVVLHLPIGWLMMVPIVDLLGRKFKWPGFTQAARFILLFGALSAVLAALFGFTLASSDGYSGKLVETHMWAGIITCSMAILAFVFKEASLVYRDRRLTLAYASFLTVALVSITIGGHLGGALVQGEGYLSEKMPLALKQTLGIREYSQPELSLDSPLYASLIEPVLKQRCSSCHSEAKNKGQFRMDSPELLFAGGKSHKSAIVPGSIDKSELLRRISLGREEKKAMPPEKKTPLDEQQIQLLNWWVTIGAPLEESINELASEQFPSEIAAIVDDLIYLASTEQNAEPIALIEPEELAQHSRELKDRFGLDVSPLSQDPKDGLQLLTMNMNQPLTEEVWQALKPLAPFIRTMDLGGVALGDTASNESSTDKLKGHSQLEHLAEYSQLEHLYLNNNPLTDGDLVYLNQLLKLSTLNLFNTGLNDAALEPLLKLRSLKKLYLHQNEITIAGLEKIKQALPRCDVIGSSTIEELALD